MLLGHHPDPDHCDAERAMRELNSDTLANLFRGTFEAVLQDPKDR